MCWLACCIYSCWWSARDPPRRYDLVCCSHRRWYFSHPFRTPRLNLGVDVFRAMSEAIALVAQGGHDPHRAHQRIRGFYDWTRVAERTEVVYRNVLSTPPYPLWTRIQRCASDFPFCANFLKHRHTSGPWAWVHSWVPFTP